MNSPSPSAAWPGPPASARTAALLWTRARKLALDAQGDRAGHLAAAVERDWHGRAGKTAGALLAQGAKASAPSAGATLTL